MWEAVPPIPLISASADNMYLGLFNHPSYTVLNEVMKRIGETAELPVCILNEVDGAYANERLHAFNLTQAGGNLIDAARCQNHATHLITVSMLSLIQKKLLSRLYQLSVFLTNLGYILRLQIALKQWIEAEMDFQCSCDMNSLQPDPLMSEIVSLIRMRHSKESKGDTGKITDQNHQSSQFCKKLDAFQDMWNGSASGPPQHFCNSMQATCNSCHCTSRAEAAHKMSKTAIDLLLTAAPPPPVPNKWSKLWAPLEFVAVGLVLCNYLPNIFNLAFEAIEFKDSTKESEGADPRMVESLHFHEVQGKRYLGSKEFLQCRESQFAVRTFIIVGEALQILTKHWLHNLNRAKRAERLPLYTLFNPRTSVVQAVLQWISHMLFDSEGRGRLQFVWRSDRTCFADWCHDFPASLRQLRHVLMSLSAWIYKRHVKYWMQFPWPLVVISDAEADPEFFESVLTRWDSCHTCCVRPGIARCLKERGITSQELLEDEILVFYSLNRGLGLLF